jgi:hypothetical protein
MNTNRRKTKYDKDPIYDAVLERMRKKGKGFFIISCGPWIHPLNKVMNCYAIMFDGFVQYKFELVQEKNEYYYKAAEIKCTEWLTLRLITGNLYTVEQLIKVIEESL